MNMKSATLCTTALSLAFVLSSSFAAGDAATVSTETSPTKAQTSEPMTGKQKATAIGATSGAVAGAVVGGPIGAVVGAGIGGYVGHQGTDANGHVSTSNTSDNTVRRAQAALNDRGYNVGAVDGRFGPNTQSAVRRFQAKSGLTESGTLDSSTLSALGVNS
jgi:peptidoglycan hydrolase-like protein with peptidoglycan-binding domain